MLLSHYLSISSPTTTTHFHQIPLQKFHRQKKVPINSRKPIKSYHFLKFYDITFLNFYMSNNFIFFSLSISQIVMYFSRNFINNLPVRKWCKDNVLLEGSGTSHFSLQTRSTMDTKNMHGSAILAVTNLAYILKATSNIPRIALL